MQSCLKALSVHRIGNLFTIAHARSFSHIVDNETFGKNGHYDIIIVGGGGAGVSLAGAIGKRFHYFQTELQL